MPSGPFDRGFRLISKMPARAGDKSGACRYHTHRWRTRSPLRRSRSTDRENRSTCVPDCPLSPRLASHSGQSGTSAEPSAWSDRWRARCRLSGIVRSCCRRPQMGLHGFARSTAVSMAASDAGRITGMDSRRPLSPAGLGIRHSRGPGTSGPLEQPDRRPLPVRPHSYERRPLGSTGLD